MLVGNKAGGGSEPDWDSISGSRVGADAQSTGAYVRNALQVSKQALDPQKQFSADLIQAIDTCLPVRCLPTNDEPTATLSPQQVIDRLLAQSQSADVGNTTALPQYRSQVETALRKVDILCQSAAYMTQMAGTTANGLSGSPTPEAKGKAAEIAVAAAQFKIDVTRANLSASRDAYMQVSQERQRQQSEITRTIVEMTRVDLENVTLKGMRYFFEPWRSPPTDRPRFYLEMIPILRKAIGSFNILRARFSQLAQFFHSIGSLMKNVMGNHIASLADALRNGQKLVLGGVSLPGSAVKLVIAASADRLLL